MLRLDSQKMNVNINNMKCTITVIKIGLYSPVTGVGILMMSHGYLSIDTSMDHDSLHINKISHVILRYVDLLHYCPFDQLEIICFQLHFWLFGGLHFWLFGGVTSVLCAGLYVIEIFLFPTPFARQPI